MRVTSEAFHRHAAAAIEVATQRFAEFQRQVATGKRVERGSHDPAAASAVIAERGRLAATDVYKASGNSAQSRLLVADAVLSDLTQQLDAAQVAIAGVRNSTTTPAQREARARELEAIRDAVLRDLNTSFDGTYLFGGTAAITAPYAKNNAGVVSAYQGAAQEVSVDIDLNIEATVSFNGEAIARGAEADDVFVEFDRAIAAARAGSSADLDTAMAGLQRAFTRVSEAQGRVGASLKFIDDAQARLGAASRAATARIASLEDANMAAAISGMAQADTVYRAALGAAAQLEKPSLMDYLK